MPDYRFRWEPFAAAQRLSGANQKAPRVMTFMACSCYQLLALEFAASFKTGKARQG